MKESEISLDSACQLFIVAPFWTSCATVGVSPHARPETLADLQRHLNGERRPKTSWTLEKFIAPRTLRLRKYGQLWTEFSFNEDFTEKIRSAIGESRFTSVFGRATYFDYGIGCIEISVLVDNVANTELPQFASSAANAKLLIVEECVNGLPHADINLVKIDQRISEFLSKKLSGLTNKLRPSYNTEMIAPDAQIMCGPVSRNLLFTQTPEDVERSVSLSDLQEVANCFLNEVTENSGKTGSDVIPVNHVGFEGAVAVVRTTEPHDVTLQTDMDSSGYPSSLSFETAPVRRTKLLWSMVHMYWSGLFTASEGFYAMSPSHTEISSRSLKSISEEIDELDEFQKIISMIRFESQPEKIVVEGEDRIRYNAVWNAYDSEELIRALSQIQGDAELTLQSLRDRAQKLMQSRVGAIITAFTLLTVVSVIVDIIVLYDVNAQLSSPIRMALLGVGVLAILLIGFMAFGLSTFFGRPYGRSRKKG